MASSGSDEQNEEKSENSDNLSEICGYKDVNEFSQVTNFRCYFVALHVM